MRGQKKEKVIFSFAFVVDNQHLLSCNIEVVAIGSKGIDGAPQDADADVKFQFYSVSKFAGFLFMNVRETIPSTILFSTLIAGWLLSTNSFNFRSFR